MVIYLDFFMSIRFLSKKLLLELRRNNISADSSIVKKSFKAQMKLANKLNVKYAIIIGDDEIKENCVIVKNFETAEQEKVSVDELVNFLKKSVTN